jgi:hypothetical protein
MIKEDSLQQGDRFLPTSLPTQQQKYLATESRGYPNKTRLRGFKS